MYYYNCRTGESTYDIPEEVEAENKALEEEQAVAYAAWEAEAAAEQEAIQQQWEEYEKQAAEAANMNAEQKEAYDAHVKRTAEHEAELQTLINAEGDHATEEEAQRSKIAALQSSAASEITEMIANVEREKMKKQDALKQRLAQRKAAHAEKMKAKKATGSFVLHHGGAPVAPVAPVAPGGGPPVLLHGSGGPPPVAPAAHPGAQKHLMRHLRSLAKVIGATACGKWQKCEHEKTGDVFYYHGEKEVVSWVDPTGGEEEGGDGGAGGEGGGGGDGGGDGGGGGGGDGGDEAAVSPPEGS